MNAYSDFPADRINVDVFNHEKRDRPGSFYTRGECFLQSNPRDFDHTFFGINPQKATSLDPAQRKLLETVYEAFESAGIPLEKLSGSPKEGIAGRFSYRTSYSRCEEEERRLRLWTFEHSNRLNIV